MWFWIILIGIVAVVVVNLNSSAKFVNSSAILGMRTPKNWDRYEDKGCSQFRKECSKNSIDVDYSNMPNICTYLRILERKGLHIELVKDSTVRYKPKEGEYIGSEAWQDKWSRIIFSSGIGGNAFCECIKVIMAAHNFSESENDLVPHVDGLDGRIKMKDSFFIYRALYIMRYNILIRENNPALKDYEVNSSNILIERGKPNVVFSYPKDETCVSMKLSDLAIIKEGYKIRESNIKSTGNYPKVIYIDNISFGNSGLMSQIGLEVNDGNIIIGLRPPFDIRVLNERAIIAENIASIEITDNMINCVYLFLFLKLMCHKLNANKVDEVKVESFKQVDIIVVPAHIQREIIKKGMPVKDDAEQLEAVFSSYNEAYPMLRLVSK